MDPRPLSVLVLLFGLVVYVGAVSGALFAAASPPTDVGALSTLVVCTLFGVFGFLLIGRRKVPA
jgi:hypothetical protein